MSVAEAAQRLGVSTPTAYRLIRDEGVPTVTLRGLTRVPTRALNEWIAMQERRSLAVTL